MTDEQLLSNKTRFCTLLRSIERKGANLESLENWLVSSDFFVAPASTKYHSSIRGGLCAHSLNVYDNLCKLVEDFGMQEIIDSDTCKIVGLFHDISKTNFYKVDFRNKKIYSETGSKHDEAGRFDWKSVPEYVTISDTERFIYGNHETTSEYYLRQFIPLTYIESISIIHHHGNMGWDSMQDNIASVWTRYPLSLLLFIADCEAAFINENTEGNVYYRAVEEVNEQQDIATTSEVTDSE